MDKNFAIGLFLGMVGGALIIANSYKARKLVKDGQNSIKEKVSEMTKKHEQSEDYGELEDWFLSMPNKNKLNSFYSRLVYLTKL